MFAHGSGLGSIKGGCALKAHTVWDAIIDDYVTYLVAIGRPRTTVDLRRYQLRYLAKSLNMIPDAIGYDDLIGWFGRHDWKAETRRSYRSGVRGFFAWAAKTGRLPDDPAFELPQVTQGKAVARPAPDHVWTAALMAADARVGLMLRLAGELGLRRAEVARVHVRDLRHGPSGAQLVVHGKGSRQRILPVNPGLAALIAAGAAGHTPGAAAKGWLFPGDDHGHLSPAYVGTLCSRLMPDVWTLHSLRHRFASRAYRGSRNLRAVQTLLGHSNVAITERYTAVDDDEVRAAMCAAA